MFEVGDKLVYPMHGLGTIKEIKNKTILNKSQLYYFFKLDQGNMTVMIPVSQAEKIKLRKIKISENLPEVLKVLQSKCNKMDKNWKLRYSNHQDKLKDGSIKKLSEVVRDLFYRSQLKELSLGEKRLYDNAFQILIDEIAYTDNLTESEVKVKLKNYLKKNPTT